MYTDSQNKHCFYHFYRNYLTATYHTLQVKENPFLKKIISRNFFDLKKAIKNVFGSLSTQMVIT